MRAKALFLSISLVVQSVSLAAQSDSLRISDSLKIEKLRGEVVRLKLRIRELEDEAAAREKKNASTGISSLDTFGGPDKRQDGGNAFFSLTDRWDTFTESEAENCIPSTQEETTLISQIDTILHIPFDSVVQKYIDIYTIKRKNSMLKIVGRFDQYYPMFAETFAKYGVPVDFAALSIIESAVTTRAVSPAGAVGMWQIMPSVGKFYKLQMSVFVDERCDPVKATDVAARFLADKYRRYGSWALAIMSYNCGPGGIQKAIEKCGGDISYENLYKVVPQETREYLPALVAAMYVLQNRQLLYD